MIRSSRGFTLIELLVVLVIISMIMGVSSAFFTHFDRQYLLRKNAVEIMAACKIARNFSCEEKTLSYVEISKEQNWLECKGGRTAGCWHFEDNKGTGAFNRNANWKNISLSPGKTGNSALFRGKSTIDCGPSSLYRLRDGFSLSFWLFLERSDISQVIWQLGSYKLIYGKGKSLYFATGQKTITLANLPLYQWHKIEIRDDHKQLLIVINHSQQKQLPSGHKENKPEDHIIFGSPFYGKIDQAKLIALTVVQTIIFDDEITILQAPEKLYFDHYGKLDPVRHSRNEKIILESTIRKKRKQVQVIISIAGDVEISDGN